MLYWRNKLTLVLPAVGLLTSVAAASEGGEGGPSMFGDAGQAVVTIFIFLVLVFVLGRWAWKPLVTQLEKREKTIAQTIEDAQKRNQEAEELLAQYRARLDAAHAEGAELLAQSRLQAAEARDKVLADAQEQTHKLTESARQDIEQAKKQAVSELYETTAQLAADVAARVLKKQLTPQDHQRLLSESLQDMRERVSR
jgi:F-type H+-transporting ATPase subunit b